MLAPLDNVGPRRVLKNGVYYRSRSQSKGSVAQNGAQARPLAAGAEPRALALSNGELRT